MKPKRPTNVASWTVTIATGIFMLVSLVLILRISRGLLGLLLAGLAVFLVYYWVRELRRTVKREWILTPKPPQLRDKWDYELVESGGTFTLVAEVPGPASLVEAKVDGRMLQIHGGNSFRKRVKLPTNLRIQAASYVNGVLNLRLLRAEENSQVIFDEPESYDTP